MHTRQLACRHAVSKGHAYAYVGTYLAAVSSFTTEHLRNSYYWWIRVSAICGMKTVEAVRKRTRFRIHLSGLKAIFRPCTCLRVIPCNVYQSLPHLHSLSP